MPSYRVTNRITKETYDVEAPFAQDACERLGWTIGDCYVELLRESPFSNISARPPRGMSIPQGPRRVEQGFHRAGPVKYLFHRAGQS